MCFLILCTAALPLTAIWLWDFYLFRYKVFSVQAYFNPSCFGNRIMLQRIHVYFTCTILHGNTTYLSTYCKVIIVFELNIFILQFIVACIISHLNFVFANFSLLTLIISGDNWITRKPWQPSHSWKQDAGNWSISKPTYKLWITTTWYYRVKILMTACLLNMLLYKALLYENIMYGITMDDKTG